jgi:valyl-tRNA synthetase
LRFTLAAMESQGRDIKLDEKRVEGYRNFATKLWNAARFLQMNGVGASQSIAAPSAELPVNRWIIGEVVETLAKLDRAFDELRFDEMADTIYHFTWGTFCDWYVELVKGAFDEETKRVAAWAFDQILVMLHPFMPFVTEELWNANDRPYELIVARWPEPDAQQDPRAKAEVEWLTGLIADIRATKSALGTADKSVNAFISKADDDKFGLIDRYLLTIKRMARLSEISVRTPDGVQQLTGTFGEIPFDAETIIAVEGEGKVQVPYPGVIGTLDFFGLVDLEVERGRLSKAISAAEKERDSLAGRLSNPAFTERAKPEAVEKARSDHAEKSAEADRYRAALERLG